MNATLLSEIESLRRERNELWNLVRSQEASEAELPSKLSPRAAAHGAWESRCRSLERHWEQERLVEAQEATANMQCPSLALTIPVLAAPVRSPISAPSWPGSQVERWASPGAAMLRSTHRRPASQERVLAGRFGSSPLRSARGAARRAPSAEGPAVGGRPRGSGHRGPGCPEGSGCGLGRGNSYSRRSNSYHRPSALGRVESSAALQDALSDALRDLGGARGALADAARQLSIEASKRNAEALRLHRFEQTLAASLHGFGRELRAIRAESSRLRQEASRPRCRSCTRC